MDRFDDLKVKTHYTGYLNITEKHGLTSNQKITMQLEELSRKHNELIDRLNQLNQE